MLRSGPVLAVVLFLLTAGQALAVRVSPRSAAERLDINGYLHVQWRQDFDVRARPGYGFVLRRARVEFAYRFDERASAALELGADKLELTLKDASIAYRIGRPLRLIAGLRKMPFSREELEPSSRMLFVERSAVNDAFGRAGFLGRDLGLTVEGEFLSPQRPVGYALGVYNGNRGRRYRDNNNAKQFVQRLTFSPLPALVAGLSASQRNDSLTGRLVAAGGADAALNLGRVNLTAEVLVGALEPGQLSYGGYVGGGWRLGSFEPGLRVEHVAVASQDENRATVLTAGTNWYLHRRVRLKANLAAGIGAEPGNVLLIEAQAGF